ncbi:MAG: hypothetical protein ABIR39_23030 [Nocardioides sp.]
MRRRVSVNASGLHCPAPDYLEDELNAFVLAGIDGFFTDNPTVRARVAQ